MLVIPETNLSATLGKIGCLGSLYMLDKNEIYYAKYPTGIILKDKWEEMYWL